MVVSIHSGEIAAPASAMAMLWAVAEAPKQDNQPSGDGFLLMRDQNRVIFAVADGAGSGSPAREASSRCLDVLSTSNNRDLERLFEACHQQLIGTRGAALGVAVVDLDQQSLEWAALGDIDGVVFSGPGESAPVISVIQRPGTLGHSKPKISPQRHQILPGQMVAMSTDGVSRSYRDLVLDTIAPTDFASSRLERYGRNGDDRTFAAFTLKGAAP